MMMVKWIMLLYQENALRLKSDVMREIKYLTNRKFNKTTTRVCWCIPIHDGEK